MMKTLINLKAFVPFIIILLIQTGCDVGSLQVTSTGPTANTTAPVSALPFGGVSSLTNITGTSVQLNWTSTAGAVSYSIYEIIGGTAIYNSNVLSPASSSVVTGLTPGQTYTFRVKLLDSNGLEDDNTNDLSTATIGVTPPSALTYSSNPAVYTVGSLISINSPTVAGGAITSYSISPTLPTGLSFDTTNGQITGTPSALSNATGYTITANNSGGSTSVTVSISVNFAGLSSITGATGSTLTLNWTNIANAVSYTIFNTTSGSPVFISTVNAPTSSYTVTGLSAGTNYKFQIRATNVLGVTDTNTTQFSANTISTGPPSSLTYSTNPAVYFVGSAISTNSPTVSGGAVTSYSISPSLPTGLSFNTTNGQITGTPSILSNAANYTITATNAGGSTTATLALTANFSGISSITGATGSTLTLNWTNIANATAYNIFNTTSGSPVFVTSVNAPASSYTVTGLSAGTSYKFQIRATNALGVTDNNTSELTGNTISTVPPNTLTYSVNSALYSVGVAITANSPSSGGGAVTSYSISPTLPTGLSFNTTTGQITGTASVMTNAANYTITASNAGGSTTATLSITTNFAGLTSITVATGSSLTLNWTNISNATSYSIYNMTSGSPVFVSTVNAPTATFTATALSVGTTYTYRVRATNNSGVTDTNTVSVSGTTLGTAPPSALTYSTNSAVYSVGTAITTNAPSASGGVITSYAISPSLPTGLSFNTTNGQITGTPSVMTNATNYTVTATNAGGSTTATLSITTNFAGLTSITGVTGAGMTLNWINISDAVSYSIYNMTSGSPVFVSTVNAPIATYAITGLSAGTLYTYRIHATNALGVTDTNTTNLSATTVSTVPPSALTYSTNPAVYTLSVAITTNSPSSSGGTVASYSISPTLPTGLSFNTTNGQITGTPSVLSATAAYTVTATNAGGSTTATLNLGVSGFPGITSISNVTGTSMQLNWTNQASAAGYFIYNMTSGSPVYLTYITAPASSYIVTGLSTSTTYAYRVRMIDSGGNLDSNINNISATTTTLFVTFNGWNNVQSLGAKTPVTQSGLSSAAASITLNFNAMTSNGTITSYNIYRATTSGGQNFSSPLATGITTAALSYTDSASLVAGTTYYYVVQPVISGTATSASATTDLEIAVPVPPSNMALLHRWIVNLETCGLMGRTADRTNNYRCNYIGPAGNGTYYDFNGGVNLFVDTYGVGCNYTPGTACGNSYGCLGSGAPAGALGAVGNVYYDRGSGNCYLKTASTTWTSANTAGFTAAQVALISSNAPGLPPLVVIDQVKSSNICTQQTVPGYSVTKRLLRHSEQIKAAAWPASFSDATITSYQNGTSLNTTGYCNSNSGSGLTYDNLEPPANLETIPGTLASNIFSVRTGSTSTQNCVSRYGIQDMVGNVWQWSSDQLNTCSSTTHTCQAMTSQLDTSNTDWNGFMFDGTTSNIGPGGGGSNVTEWNFSAMTFSATQFQAVLGLPMIATASSIWDYLTIGSSAGQFNSAKFHGDHFWLYTDNGNGSPARGAIAGGGWNNGADSGRFSLSLYGTPASTNVIIGARCALPAVP